MTSKNPNMHPRAKRFLAVSLGCPKNRVDTEVLCGLLAASGFVPVAKAQDADVVLINTCAFIASARDEAAREIRRALRWKKRGRRRRVVVAGCYPEYDREILRKDFPEIDLILGVDDIPRVVDRFHQLWNREKRAGCPAASSRPPAFLYDHTLPRLLTTPPGYAYVKIADGCDHACRFCTIPSLRGRFRSRTPESVLAECRELLGLGVRELILTAQDTSYYGAERNGRPQLAELLRQLDALPGEFWIRCLYFHPRHVTAELLETMAAATHILPYIDIPLQHISDAMLRAMGRRMRETETRDLMEKIRTRLPQAAVRTTFIVGYPGETDAEFETLLAFVEEYRFDRLGVFLFSPEPGTPAARSAAGPETPPARVARERRARIMEVQQRISAEKNQAMIGREIPVIVDAVNGRTAIARSPADAPEIDGLVRVRSAEGLRPGRFLRVRITEAGPYDLHAVPLIANK